MPGVLFTLFDASFFKSAMQDFNLSTLCSCLVTLDWRLRALDWKFIEEFMLDMGIWEEMLVVEYFEKFIVSKSIILTYYFQ